MFLEVIFEVVIVFDPEFPIRVHNKLHQLPSRIAYMNLGIVPLTASAFFFWIYPAHSPVFSTFGLREPSTGGGPLFLRIDGTKHIYPIFGPALQTSTEPRQYLQPYPA